MVGPPRVRQVRHETNCTVATAMEGMVPMCGYFAEESEEAFGEYEDFRWALVVKAFGCQGSLSPLPALPFSVSVSLPLAPSSVAFCAIYIF